VIKKKITFEDFNGNEQTQEFFFNLSAPEVFRIETDFKGGLENYINNLNNEKDPKGILVLFERLIRESYGVKSADGAYFIKEKAIVDKFYQSAAYNALFMELMMDADKAAKFFVSLIPEVPNKN
jgi:hypothetical protein